VRVLWHGASTTCFVRSISRTASFRRLALTDEGRALLARAVPLWRKTHAELENALPKKRQADIRAAMNALVY